MDLSKSYEFFQPEKHKGRIHIIGCGSVGSTVAENMARLGVRSFELWDFDEVEPHNIANQMFTKNDIGKFKVDAVSDLILSINDEASVKVHKDGWNGETLSGYVFLCVDSIDIRRRIVEQHKDNMFVKAMFDFRTRLTDAQHYAADWSDEKMKENLLNSMDFTHEEAADETPMSACGVILGVASTVRLIAAMGVNNYVRFVKGQGIWKMVYLDGFSGILDCF